MLNWKSRGSRDTFECICECLAVSDRCSIARTRTPSQRKVLIRRKCLRDRSVSLSKVRHRWLTVGERVEFNYFPPASVSVISEAPLLANTWEYCGKGHNTYSATSGNYSCSGAVVSQTVRAYSPSPRTLTFVQRAICSPTLLFNGLHPSNSCSYMDYYSFTDPGGLEGWVGPLAT